MEQAMKKNDAINWLKLFGASVPQSQPRPGWVVSDCLLGPWRHEGGKSSPEVFGVRVEDGDSFVNCFSCGYHGKQSDVVLLVKYLSKTQFHKKYPYGELLQLIALAEETAELDGLNSPDIEEMLFGKKEGMHAFPNWWLESFAGWRDSKDAIDYLKKRSVPDSIADTLGLKYDTEQKRVCFPVSDFDGVLRGLHGRSIDDKEELRYRMYQHAKRTNPIVWLGENWVDLSKPVIFVEGPFDLTSTMRVYRNVVSPLFANPSLDKLKRMADVMDVFTLLDRGKGGDSGRLKIEKSMPHSIVTHLMVPEHRKDPGACTTAELFEIIDPYMKPDDIILD